MDSARTQEKIRADLMNRSAKSLLKAARKMTAATFEDWKAWRKGSKA
jgi:hypothetical protein